MDNEGVPSGVVSFTDYRPEAGSSHWGFYAAPGAPRGTGISLAVCALDEAFDRLGLHKLNAEVLSNNGQSIRFHEKLGFRREGLFRENFFDGAAYIDGPRMARRPRGHCSQFSCCRRGQSRSLNRRGWEARAARGRSVPR
jgi:RimJ/RimL family protein N-acetyltransferase